MKQIPHTIICENCNFAMVINDFFPMMWPENDTSYAHIHNKKDITRKEYSYMCHQCGHYNMNAHAKNNQD